MRLYVLRHGDANYDAPDDASRELSAKGVGTLKALGHSVRPKEFHRLEAIWHSPLARAVQSAQLVKEACQIEAPLQAKAGMQPEDDPIPLVAEIAECEGDLLLVGHNPHLTFLAAHLLTGRTNQASIVFKKAGLLCLERVGPPSAELPGGHWALSFFLIPRVTGLHKDYQASESD
ncbi:MAG: phosphohistidine phosphatase SixA [Opitutales bacterium]